MQGHAADAAPATKPFITLLEALGEGCVAILAF